MKVEGESAKSTQETMATEANEKNKPEEEKCECCPHPLKTVSTPLIYSQQSSRRSKACVLGSPIIENHQYDIFYPDSLKDGRLYKYDYRDLHADLEKQHFCGVYGWDNACYWGIAERKAKTDLTKHYSTRHAV